MPGRPCLVAPALQTSSEKKRKACQYVTCIGTMLFFDGAGTVGSGETALEAACAGCHRCIYIVRMRSRLEVEVVQSVLYATQW